jgi:hypothetical protein
MQISSHDSVFIFQRRTLHAILNRSQNRSSVTETQRTVADCDFSTSVSQIYKTIILPVVLYGCET